MALITAPSVGARLRAAESKVGEKLALYSRNPRWALMRALGRWDIARSAPTWLGRGAPAQGRSNAPTALQGANPDEVVASVERDGLYLGLRLPQPIVSEILEFARSATCYGDRDLELGFRYPERAAFASTHGRSFLLGTYYNTHDCPAIAGLASDGALLDIAEAYLGAPPVLQGTVLWWSFPATAGAGERSKAAQMYHFDMDDYRFIKFFFYLTDVDESSGPHVSVVGTHKRKKLRHQLRYRRYPDHEIVRHYGAERVVQICGPAGSGFAEDTRCFHKGTPPVTGDRLVLQFEFARSDYGLQHDHRSPSELVR